MKKLTVLTLVVIMLAVSVVPALAAGGPPAERGTGSGICDGSHTGYGSQNAYGSQGGYGSQAGNGLRTPFALSGTITTVDATNQTVSVSVACGNRLAYPYVEQEVTLVTNSSTRFLLRNADGSVTPITFADLAAGQQISSHGALVEGVWTASRITSGALLNCLSR